ncbi:hypothetical protein D9V41_06400 [Aeromicrobium phragmitis]|uniref:Bacterial Ig domain-containing protein n=1 Tax=Aeromicrobium phragmitis TaxID=2478914 RepID=A0A3L8PPD5_9ACTN|nr:Ig-like domain repeat protein [Aeromicrobium phragmitis]RLV56689.1 hypothetical protein D9V41_06400 [Aeromicrobium phragmitis]
MTVARRSFATSSSRLGIVLATSGAAAVVAAAAFTVQPRVATGTAADLVPASDSTVPSTTSVHALTPSIEAGETVRVAAGVAARGTRPEGRVELQVGDQTVTRDLSVGTAVAGVRVDDPGTVRVQARYLGGNGATGSWSEPVDVVVQPR